MVVAALNTSDSIQDSWEGVIVVVILLHTSDSIQDSLEVVVVAVMNLL
jgi:hypothetical protein